MNPNLKTYRNKAYLLILMCFVSTNSWGQSVIPPSADPARIQNTIESPLPIVPESTLPAQSKPIIVDAPEGAEAIEMVLNNVVISGATVFSKDEITSTYRHLLGKTIKLTQIYEISNDITRLYTDSGYILSRAIIPEQEISDGVVNIQVIEGFITSYEIQGEENARSVLEAYAEKLISLGPLKSENLERYLLLMNDVSGSDVKSVLSPSSNTNNGAHITLIAEHNKAQGFANFDNLGNSYIGPNRITLGGQLNNILQSSTTLNGLFLWAPDSNELQYYSTGFHNYVGDEGTKIGVNASISKARPSLPNALGGLLEPDGEALFLGFSVDHPFIRTRNLNVYGGLNFDILKNKTDYAPGLSAIETKDSQRVLRASGRISYQDRFFGFNAGNATLSKGLDILGASHRGDSNLSRPEGDPEFTKLNIGASRLQYVSGPFNVLVAGTAQYSANTLLASEEFGFGGNEFGRGYDPSEITGEHGLAGKFEFIYNGNTQLKVLNAYQIFTFYDVGKVWNRDVAVGQQDSDSAASLGIGTRLTFNQSVRGDAFVAKPLTRGVTSRGDDGQDLRFKFSINTVF